MGDDGETVTLSITAPGYRSETSFPIGIDAKDAVVSWLAMQLSYLSRWTPGSTASIRETRPVPTDQGKEA